MHSRWPGAPRPEPLDHRQPSLQPQMAPPSRGPDNGLCNSRSCYYVHEKQRTKHPEIWAFTDQHPSRERANLMSRATDALNKHSRRGVQRPEQGGACFNGGIAEGPPRRWPETRTPRWPGPEQRSWPIVFLCTQLCSCPKSLVPEVKLHSSGFFPRPCPFFSASPKENIL